MNEARPKIFLKISSVMPHNPAPLFISTTSSIQPLIASCIASLLASFASFFIPKSSKGEIGMDAIVLFSFSSYFTP